MVKNSPANVRDVDSIPRLGRSPGGGGHGNPPGIPVWRIPWTEESGRLQSTGSHSVGHDGSDLACMHTGCVMSYAGSDVTGYSATRSRKRTISSKWGVLEEMTLDLRWVFLGVCVCVLFLFIYLKIIYFN